jgi:hypothetical protein
MLMNSAFVLDQARHFADRVVAETGADLNKPEGIDRAVAHAWRLAYQRPAAPEELALARAFLRRQGPRLRGALGAGAGRAALANLCQQLLASNEFLYVD